MTKALNLALIGECMIELQEISPGIARQTFGGDTLNTAIYCARLTSDLPLTVEYVTALGTDTFSDQMVAFWQAEGVGSRLVQRIAGENPGLYYIETDQQGERVFHYWRNTSAAKRCFEFQGSENVLHHLADFDALYLSGISLAILTPKSRTVLLARLRALAAAGMRLYFDCNYRPHLWSSVAEAQNVYRQLYDLSAIVFLTMDEATLLLNGARGKKVGAALRNLGAQEIVIKNGAKACMIELADRSVQVAAQPVQKVVDTTAAGDSFSAVYLVARYFGCMPEDAAKMAHATAAYVVAHKGAIAPMQGMPITGQDIVAACGVMA